MSYVRMILRAFGVVTLSLVCYLALLLIRLVTIGRPLARRSVQSAVLAFWARGVLLLIGMRRELVGSPPDVAGLFVANHLSYVDIILIAASMRTAFVAKSDVRSWPVVGHVVHMAGTVFVNRERHRSLLGANDAIAATLDSGTSVVVFAEGSSTDGQSVLPFRPSLLDIAARRKIPVHYGYLTYSLGNDDKARQQTRDQICWWGDAGFFAHIGRLLMLPGFNARLVFGSDGLVSDDRKHLAAELHERVVGQFNNYSWS